MSVCPSDTPRGNIVDKDTLIVLRADLTAQMALVKSISLLIQKRAEGLHKDDPIRLESVAYQIHNFYSKRS